MLRLVLRGCTDSEQMEMASGEGITQDHLAVKMVCMRVCV